MSYLHIIKASAGSGKTHKLTGEYLRMAFETDDAYKYILAVTFTVKAAGEMKTRILEELHKLAVSNSSPYNAELKAHYPHFTPQLIQNRAQTILDSILHDYSSLNISTIDSFVQKVLRAFAFEMGAPAGFNIELDTETVLADLTAELYRNISADKTLQNWLEQFSIQRISEGKKWSFKADIQSLGKELFKENFMRYADKISLPNQEEGNKLYKQMLQHLRQTIQSITEYHQALREQANELISENFEFGRSPMSKIVKLLTKLELTEIEPDLIQLVKDIVHDTSLWFNKSEKKPQNLPYYHLIPNIQALALVHIKFLDDYLEKFHTANLIRKQFNVFGIIQYLRNLLPEYRKKNNVMLISDSTYLLRSLIDNNETPFIYEKMGMRIRHLLIDEFQDTSGFQMDNFKPVMANSLGEGYDSLIVGDIKQSIYRWRNGDWKLLHNGVKKEFGNEMVRESTLTTNYRSKKNIIDFNNMLFPSMAAAVQMAFNQHTAHIKTEQSGIFENIINNAYADVKQESPGAMGGKVVVCKLDTDVLKSENIKPIDFITQNLAERIDSLLRTPNYKAKDICILVRKKADGAHLMKALHKFQLADENNIQYDLVSADSASISNSIHVNIIIYLLKYINRPTDILSLATAVHLWYEARNEKLIGNWQLFSEEKLLTLIPEEFKTLSVNTYSISVFEMVDNLIEIFQLRADSTALYLNALLDMIFQFTQSKGNSLNNFLQWWELKGFDKSLLMPDNMDAVQVMTIHKSKGLAFKIVMLPFVDWSLHKYDPELRFWVNNPFQEFSSLSPVPVAYTKDITQSMYAAYHTDELMHQYMDAMNMLYVALTRPRNELYIWISPPGAKSSVESISGYINNSLQYSTLNFESEVLEGAEILTYAPDFKPEQPRKPDNSKILHNKTNTLLNWRNKLVINHKSSDFFSMSLPYIQQQKEYGIFMHKVLSTIDTHADLDKGIKQLLASGMLSRTDVPVLKMKLTNILSHPQASIWFNPGWKIIKEKALLDEKGHLHIPDRIVMNEKEIQIIDFKFARPSEEHKAQITQYKKLMQQMYELPVKTFLYYPELNEVTEVV